MPAFTCWKHDDNAQAGASSPLEVIAGDREGAALEFGRRAYDAQPFKELEVAVRRSGHPLKILIVTAL